jgi:uncharacterized integral membrane protein (TIGR00698 family)
MQHAARGPAPAVAPPSAGAARGTRPAPIWPGLAVAALLAAIASYAGRYAPILGAPVLAIVLGVLVRSVVPLPSVLRAGVAFTAKKVLQAAIIVSGFGLSFVTVVRTGVATLPVTIVTIAVALVLGWLLGRALRVEGALRTLVSVGTAICGASAIAAVSTVIEPEEAEVALAIATVFFYNILAVLLFPPLGHLMHLTQSAFGVWAGTAINDTSSVVAAGYAYGSDAGAQATIVKLTRATLILPIVAAIALWRARDAQAAGPRVPWKRVIPWFIVWFLVAAIVNTLGVVPSAWHGAIAQLAVFLISAALAAIGLQTHLAKLIRTGARPLALGLLLWVAVAASSLATQHATGL